MSININNVFHTYSKKTPFEYKALDGISLEIKDNSFVAIIGKTGSGKSTLIQHLNAILLPDEGTIEVDEYKITPQDTKTSYKNLRQHIGLVFQFSEYQLFEETILKDVMFGPLNFDVEEDKAKELAKTYLNLVGIKDELFEKSPFDLSGGQKRRVAIAGVLAMEPDIIVLDEPTAGLDPQGANEMMQMFLELKNDFNKTLIIVSHDMDFVYKYADEVILLSGGKKIFHQDTVSFFNNDHVYQYGIEKPQILALYENVFNKKAEYFVNYDTLINLLVEAINNVK
ncbi:MAG: energy-coupling factor transporter ATPase [Bacilli bacterium]|jgi:energy-coupling factor transport system ATP-binding protein|nr:energy-coupling factor transporter ATPase [Bacilli bacterium]